MLHLRLPSGEMRMVPIICRATIGHCWQRRTHNLINIGKAGRKRHMGIRPTVRGSVMNPNDHPHGGGEGKCSGIGRPGPCTPWGKPALGLKTRKKNKAVQQADRKKTRRQSFKQIIKEVKIMARSLKKGPFADESLLKKVDAIKRCR